MQLNAASRLPFTPLTPPVNINISRMRGNQSEGAIAIDPHDPNRVFALSNLERGGGLFSAVSSDGGLTWSKTIIANGKDKLAKAYCDPSAAFDDFGNLFITYLDSRLHAVQVATSTDGGKTFRRLTRFTGPVDQPTITTGPGSVWITFEKSQRIVATGARVTGLGKVGTFEALQRAPGSSGGNFGDIAVGRNGQVLLTYMKPAGGSGPAKIYVNLDSDGLGARGFGKAVLATSTGVGGFKPIAAQRQATIDAEPGLAYDRSGTTSNGRVYLVYTSLSAKGGQDTDIFLRISTDNGAHWGAPMRVNDDTSARSQFLPRIAVDQTTGHVGISWHDARNDNGRKPNSTNNKANDDTEFWGVVAEPDSTGLILGTNFRISGGISNASRAENRIDYGDYTGLAFSHGAMLPIWADNSNSTGNNPDGTLRTLDLHIARIDIGIL